MYICRNFFYLNNLWDVFWPEEGRVGWEALEEDGLDQEPALDEVLYPQQHLFEGLHTMNFVGVRTLYHKVWAFQKGSVKPLDLQVHPPGPHPSPAWAPRRGSSSSGHRCCALRPPSWRGGSWTGPRPWGWISVGGWLCSIATKYRHPLFRAIPRSFCQDKKAMLQKYACKPESCVLTTKRKNYRTGKFLL